MKVVINRCYGGFGLSNEAFEKLLERKGIAYEKTKAKHAFRTDDFDYWKTGQVGEDDAYLSYYDLCDDRSDPDLVAVVEEMGQSSWGWAAELAIVNVDDDVNGNWYIEEYDGLEHVAERHRTWS